MIIPPEKIRSITKPIFQTYSSIELAYLYGSSVTQRGTNLSDIDIGIYVVESLTTTELLSVQLNLLGELTSALNSNKIDLTIMNLASNVLNFEIMKSNFPLFVKNEDFRIDVEHRIHSVYLDRRYYEALFDEIFLQQVRGQGTKLK